MSLRLPILLALVFVTLRINAQTIQNGSFENWSITSQGNDDPDGWVTNNMIGFPPRIYKEAYSNTGNYAAAIAPNGIASLNIPLTSPPDTLFAYVRSDINTIDSVTIRIQLYKANAMVGQNEWIGTTNILNWSQVAIPVTSTASSIDSGKITLSGGSHADRPPTMLYVDDLSFTKNLTTGLNLQSREKATLPYIKVFNSRSNQSISILLDDQMKSNSFSLHILNNSGQLMYAYNDEMVLDDIIELNYASWPKGIYFCYIFSSKNSKCTVKSFLVL